jgi:hypothetical protein
MENMTEEFLSRIEQAKAARRETLAKFRFEQIKELGPLPKSRMTIFVRDVSMMDLLMSGKLPEPLVDVIQSATNDKNEIDLKQIARNAVEFNDMVDGLILMSVVEPPIARTGDEDHLGLNELPSDDKMFIYQWLNREVPASQSFREGQSEPLPPV